MRLVLARSLWGLEDRPEHAHAALATVAAAGYDAVSCPVQTLPDHDAFAEALRDAGLTYLPQVFTFGRSVEDHLRMLGEALEASAAFAPRHVLAQGGRDGWPLEDSLRFFAGAQRLATDLGVVVAHETHRSRALFNPWITERILEEVPDPRAEMHAEHVAAHERWWDAIWAARAAAGDAELTITPEFGPPPYQPVDPRTGEPLADVNEVNDWMAARLRRRYEG